jgi:hypothetical protein
MTIRAAATLAILALPMGQIAAAQTPAPIAQSTEASDARCLAVFATLVAKGDPDTLQGARTGTLLFAGKLFGRNPSVNLEQVLRTAAASLGADPTSDLTRCAAEMTTIGNAMTTAGNALQATP